ncbi:MAG: glutathione peroxidase [Lachnospirales bacterium]
MSFYDYSAFKINGYQMYTKDLRGKVVLVVNTATNCKYTSQFKDLEAFYQTYHKKGLEILTFPCNQFANQEPRNNNEIVEFCTVNFGVTFDIFRKIDVNGELTHPLYKYLKKQKKDFFSLDIKWNFTKFLIDRQGNVIKRYSPDIPPRQLENDMVRLINQ